MTGSLEGASARERWLVRAFQAGGRISSTWAHRGFGAGCKILQPMVPDKFIRVRLNDDAVFEFPFGDEYWSTILDRNYVYERDIERFFRSVADAEYTFLDCGANYGYWSTLVSSRPYGAQFAIAIEPSMRNYEKLANNAAINGSRFQMLRSAIGANSGTARLSGQKHEAMTIAHSDQSLGESVAVISLDDLMEQKKLSGSRCIIKLDVEGVEIEAMIGGKRLLQTDCVVICEDHGSDAQHAVSRHILTNTDLKLFCYDPHNGKYIRLLDLSPLDRIKTATNHGYNVLATSSPFWEARIGALTH